MSKEYFVSFVVEDGKIEFRNMVLDFKEIKGIEDIQDLEEYIATGGYNYPQECNVIILNFKEL